VGGPGGGVGTFCGWARPPGGLSSRDRFSMRFGQVWGLVYVMWVEDR
jgi:hypothetical protein